MCGGGECTPEHEAFTRHLMGCRACFAPANNYCATGKTLRIDSDAAFILGVKTIEGRRYWMATVRRQQPDLADAIEARVRQLFEEARK